MPCESLNRVFRLAWHCLLLHFCPCVVLFAYAQINRTIDDTNGDPFTGNFPTYAPSNLWELGQNDAGLAARPVATQALQGTWHDATHHSNDTEPLTVTFTFNGTAVYVYCIIDNQLGYTTLTALNFTIDGEDVGWYTHNPDSSASQFAYNVPVYSNNSVSNGNHQFVMTAGGNVDSLILFDYALYTFDSSSSSSSSTSASTTSSPTSSPPGTSSSHGSAPIGAIIGGVVGGVAVLMVAAGLFWFWRRRNRSQGAPTIEAFGAGNYQPPPGFTTSMLPVMPVTSVTNTNPSNWSVPSTRGQRSTSIEGTMYPQTASQTLSPTTAREEEIKRQLRGYEQSVAALRAREGSIHSSSGRSQLSSRTTSTAREDNRRLRLEIAVMQQEMQRLRDEHRTLMWEMESAPPPEYGESLQFDSQHGLSTPQSTSPPSH